MRCKFLEQDYEQRLNGGLVFFKKKPVLVHATLGRIDLYGFPDNERIATVLPNDENLDISAPRLGYVNISSRAVYVYRRPLRQYKQSLTVGSLTTFTPMARGGANINDIFNTKQFAEMLVNKYPPLDAAIKFLSTKNGRGMAISRNVALVRDSYGFVHVFFKMEEVGIIEDLSKRVITVPNSTMAKVVSKCLSGFDWEIR